MPIGSLLDGTAFDSNEVAIIVAAFEEVLSRLGISPGSQPVREEHLATQVIAAASKGPLEQRRLVRAALGAI